MGKPLVELPTEDVLVPTEGGKPPPEILPTIEIALQNYLELGSISAAARSIGMTPYELGKYAKTPWWVEEVLRLKAERKAAEDVTITRLLKLSYDKLMEVLEHGEDKVVVLKAGHDSYTEKIKVQVPGMVVAKIVDVLFNARQELRGEKVQPPSEGNKLAELAARLEQLGQQNQVRTIDVEATDPQGRREAKLEIQDVEVKSGKAT